MTERNDKILALVAQGEMSYSEIAAYLGITRGAVSGAVDRAKKAHLKKGHARGENQPNAKLTDEKVRVMRMMSANGDKLAFIAATMGVDFTTASKAINRRTWRHVE